MTETELKKRIDELRKSFNSGYHDDMCDGSLDGGCPECIREISMNKKISRLTQLYDDLYGE